MPQKIDLPGALVLVINGVWRGRNGVTVGTPDATNNVRVVLDQRSHYDAGRPGEWAWIPLEFLQIKKG